MARTVEQILREQIGEMVLQMAQLQAQLEAAKEAAVAPPKESVNGTER